MRKEGKVRMTKIPATDTNGFAFGQLNTEENIKAESAFNFARLWQICFLIFFTSLLPNLVLSKPHACVVCIALPSNLAVVQSQIF